MGDQYEPVNRRTRAERLRADAAECERRGFPDFARVNAELAEILDPPPETERPRYNARPVHPFGQEESYAEWLDRQRDTESVDHPQNQWVPPPRPPRTPREDRRDRVARVGGRAPSRRTRAA